MEKQGKKWRRLIDVSPEEIPGLVEALSSSIPYNNIALDKNTKDMYMVWFSYLIRTPMFRTYLSYLRSGKSIYQSEDAPKGLSGFSSGYHHWFYHLLPWLWDKNPTEDDFESLWSTWTRRRGRVRGDLVKTIPWDDLQETTVHNVCGEIAQFVEDQERQPHADELKILVSEALKRSFGPFKNSNRLYLWVDPFGAQHNEIVGFIDSEISKSRGEMRRTGVCFENNNGARYNSPVAMERDSKTRGLDALRRRLNFLALEQEGYGQRSIASGCFDLEELPYGPSPLKNQYWSNIILERQSNLVKSGDPYAFCKRLTPDEITDEVAHSLRKDLQSAKITLMAVQAGWFPRYPKIPRKAREWKKEE